MGLARLTEGAENSLGALKWRTTVHSINLPTQALALVLLLSVATHPRVQGEPICFGHSLQSGSGRSGERIVRIMKALRPEATAT